MKSRQIFDSRGYPTIETDLIIDYSFFGRAAIASGRSKGIHEALELRDNNNAYNKQGVLTAVKKVNNEIRGNLLNVKFNSQEELDAFLINLDGTKNKSNLGANTILSISVAFAKARAKFQNKQLFQSISNANERFLLPKPMLNIINGGIHADNNLDIQEFMIVPVKYTSINKNLKIACEVFHSLKNLLQKQSFNINIGDEGGFTPNIDNTHHVLDIISKSIELAGYKVGLEVYLALDIAANVLYKDGYYNFHSTKMKLTTNELVEFYKDLCTQYPIISIEDPFFEEDIDGWQLLNKIIGKKVRIVGDDLFVTNSLKLKYGIEHKLANSILIKMNQIGTLTETLDSINIAKKNDFIHIISHRSGETEDTTIAHLSVSTSSPFIKTGSISRTDRVCKYNELIRIEESLKTI